jgi:hypothetical protein
MERDDYMKNQAMGSLNPISTLGVAPDETFAMLEEVTDYRLTPEQKVIAKMSAEGLLDSAILSGRAEIDIIDLVKLWDNSSVLTDFSCALRRAYLHN